MRVRILCLATLCMANVPLPLAAAEGPEVAVRRLVGEIRLDGVLNEDAWRESPAIREFVQVEPRPGEPATESTRVWLAYSKDALYIAVRCEDRSPRMVATDMRRDAQLENNDNIEVVLDTFHDHRNAYYFATNAAGALVDGRITENRLPALEWDGIWSVRTRIEERGWTAEFEIPFKTVGFNPSIREWGFNISRYLARGRETSRWASPSLDVQLSQAVRAGHLTGLEGISQGVGLDIKPYGIAGFTRDIGKVDRLSAARNGGADIFYRITSNLVSSTTFNTDFAETEVDSRQVNLTRFPLFFPEKRSFFLEDAGIFEFAQTNEDGGGDLVPFFSRTIGLVRGREAPIRAGEKLTGKIGRFDVGLLDSQTGALDSEGGSPRIPGRNLAVGRVKANFLSQSYIGALFTNGDPTGETGNQVAGLDLKLATSNFLNREKNLSLMLFGSKSRTTGLEGKDAAYGGVIAYPNDFLSLQYKWMEIGENYNPALGFVPRKGVRVSSTSADVRPRPKKLWNIRQMSFEFEYNDYYNLANRRSETQELKTTPLQWFLNGGEMIGYEWSLNREELFEPWEIADGVILPAGRYSFNSHGLQVESSPGKPVSVSVQAGTGSFFSGTRRQAGGELTWRRDRHFTTSLRLDQNWVRLPQGSFDTSLLMYRLDYSFTPSLTLANFIQYDTESKNIGLQSRLRWIPKPGNDVFVVLNHAWQENQFNRFEAAQTRFRVKFNYTFRF